MTEREGPDDAELEAAALAASSGPSLGPWCAAEEARLCACGMDVAPGDPVRSWGGELLCGECGECGGDDVPGWRPIVDVPTGDLL